MGQFRDLDVRLIEIVMLEVIGHTMLVPDMALFNKDVEETVELAINEYANVTTPHVAPLALCEKDWRSVAIMCHLLFV